MHITKYIVSKNITLMDILILEGDVIYISESIHTMDGVFDYARKVFDSDRRFLGRIRSSFFEKEIKWALTKKNIILNFRAWKQLM